MNVSYTNNHGIPGPIAEAVAEIDGDYSKGGSDFTTTELTAPPRIRALRKRLEKKGSIERDVLDLVYSVLGTALHYVLERLCKRNSDYVTEVRLYREFNGFKIGGQLDLYQKSTGTLWDWKSTKSTAYRDGPKAEYVQQLNINAWLLRGNGYEPERLLSGVIYRDFSKLTCNVKPPHKQAEEFSVAMWPDEAVEHLLRDRIELHKQAEEELPLCSESERWATRSVWAAQSLKSGRAIKHGLCDTREEAEDKRLAHKQPNTLGVVHRPGKSNRCQHYCSVANYCSQWAEDLNNPKNQQEQKELGL